MGMRKESRPWGNFKGYKVYSGLNPLTQKDLGAL